MTPAPAGLSESARAAWAALFGPPIAHRGLWDPQRPENTLPAFAEAVRLGYGVELDVRLSADGHPMVFHDDDLGRMTEEQGPLEALNSSDLARIRIAGHEPIPTLVEALRVLAGRRLGLVELKTAGEPEALVENVLDAIAGYDGPLALISFDAAVHAALAVRAPDVLRGAHIGADDIAAVAASEAHAHFVLPALGALGLPATVERRAEGVPAVAWTSRTPAQHDRALRQADNVIFEGYRPAVARETGFS